MSMVRAPSKFLLRFNEPETPAPGRKSLTLLAAGTSPEPTTQSFEPEDFPETAEKPAIGGLCGCVSR
jgi:hypothetical protein